MIQFAWPWVVLLLPLPWLVRRFVPPAPRVNSGTLFAPFVVAFADADLAQAGGSRRSPMLLASLVWLLLLTAAARPEWLGDAVELPETGRNLMLAVDVSGSMETPDLDQGGSQASRLDVVKQVAGEFIERRKGDRVGLILFGSQAYIQAPLTFDRTTVRTLLDETMIGIAGKQTAIGDAIGLAIKRMRTAPEGKAVLVLLTDGANTAGNVPPRRAAELAAQAGLRIHTIGVGADRMRVRGLLGSRVVNPSADLDEETLTAIAQLTGGKFYRATDRAELEDIYQALDELEPVEAGQLVVRPITAFYMWPLGGAFFFTLMYALWIISTRIREVPA